MDQQKTPLLINLFGSGVLCRLCDCFGLTSSRHESSSRYEFPRKSIMRKYDGDVETAIKECIEQGVLSDYLKHYGSEVVNMLFEEYDAERALEIKGQEEYEKGKAEGEADGEKKGKRRTLLELVKDGLLTITQAAEQANMTVEDFEIQCADLA